MLFIMQIHSFLNHVTSFQDLAFTDLDLNSDSLPSTSSALRRQVRPSKTFAATLALESGGTVFSADAMDPNRRRRANGAKTAAAVFSSRLAAAAAPPSCQVIMCV